MTPIRCLAATALAALVFTAPAHAATWTWNYSGAGIAAAGTFTTSDTPNSDGYYAITAITGSRNGVAIAGLEPAGSAIPGNDPYDVDNLVSIAGPQLTWNGFGYVMADGSWANPFSDGSTPGNTCLCRRTRKALAKRWQSTSARRQYPSPLPAYLHCSVLPGSPPRAAYGVSAECFVPPSAVQRGKSSRLRRSSVRRRTAACLQRRGPL